MNIYDKINDLASGIKETNEFKDYVAIKNEVYKDATKKEIIETFRKEQIDFQRAVMNQEYTEDQIVEKNNELQKRYEELIQDEEIKKLYDTEFKFDILIGDVYKIIGEAIREAMN